MKYICDICNTQYKTYDEANKCEAEHKKVAIMEQVRDADARRISNAFNAFIKKYKEMPNIEFTEENQDVLLGDFTDKLDKMVDVLIDIITEDDDECEDCGGERECDCCERNSNE